MNFQEDILKRKEELALMKSELQQIKDNIKKEQAKEEQVKALVESIKIGLLENMNLGNYDGIVKYSFAYCPSRDIYLSGKGQEAQISLTDTTEEMVKSLRTQKPYSMFERETWDLLYKLCSEEGINIATEDYRSGNPQILGQTVIIVTASINLTQKNSR